MSACACGCGAEVPRNKAGTRRYASDACRARAHRSRESDALGAMDEALRDLRERKEQVGDALGVEGLSAGELSRLCAEFRQLVLAILALEGRKPVERPAQKPTKADELRARRQARHAAMRAQAMEGDGGG